MSKTVRQCSQRRDSFVLPPRSAPIMPKASTSAADGPCFCRTGTRFVCMPQWGHLWNSTFAFLMGTVQSCPSPVVPPAVGGLGMEGLRGRKGKVKGADGFKKSSAVRKAVNPVRGAHFAKEKSTSSATPAPAKPQAGWKICDPCSRHSSPFVSGCESTIFFAPTYRTRRTIISLNSPSLAGLPPSLPISLAEFDAETRFRALAANGSGREGLALLDKLDAVKKCGEGKRK